MKIHIEVKDKTSPEMALTLVKDVISGGKVSVGRGIKHFCWASKFSSGHTVWVRQKKTKNSADSFVVYKD